MTFDEAVAFALPIATQLRHTLHRNPELSGSEQNTARQIQSVLETYGISVVTDLGGMHGLMCTIEGQPGGKCWGIRADMDALPIQETSDLPYASQVPGVMHACGHDGHSATLVGVALTLQQMRDQFVGRVRCLFQPAEETVSGATSVINGGGLNGVDAIVMSHGWPDLPVGTIGLKHGPAMASSDTFEVTVLGSGAHAAYPHLAKDPLLGAAAMIIELQQLVSRNISPVDSAVVSVTMFNAGTARNIIPDTATFAGTLRTLRHDTRSYLMARIDSIVEATANAHGVSVQIKWKIGTPPVVNNNSLVNHIAGCVTHTTVSGSVTWLDEPTMGAEDFAHYLEHVPGAMLRLGTDCPYHLHTPKYDFGDDALEYGIRLLASIGMSEMPTFDKV
ncbi:MAG: M20 family metallopeptidase [Armatimonadota bacterium]